MNIKRIAVVVLTLLVAVFAYGYFTFLSKNTKFSEEKVYVYIPTGSSFDDVLKIIKPKIKDIDNFKFVAEKRSYDKNVFPGRFLFK